jgi:hypothetical protein
MSALAPIAAKLVRRADVEAILTLIGRCFRPRSPRKSISLLRPNFISNNQPLALWLRNSSPLSANDQEVGARQRLFTIYWHQLPHR